MTIKISERDFSSLLRLVERSQTDDGQNQYVEIFFEYPKELGQGYILDIKLRQGFWLTITNCQRREYLLLDSLEWQHPYPAGIDSFDEVDAITYLPTTKMYRFENQKRFFEWYVDARSGELLKYGFNTAMFLEEKGVLGWLNPVAHDLIELPFLAILLTLASSGVYLFISPFLPKKNLEAEPSAIATGER